MSQDSLTSKHGWRYGALSIVLAFVVYFVAIFASGVLSPDGRVVIEATGACIAILVLAYSQRGVRNDVSEVPSMDIGPLSLLYVSIASAGFVTALTVAVTSSVATGTLPLSSEAERLLLLISFIATAIPFYHGALTYLHRTSINANRSTMVDFLALMFEALVILLLSTSSASPIPFVNWFSTLLGIDILWLLFALKGKRSDPPPGVWLYLNVIVFLFLLVGVYLNVVSDSLIFLSSLAIVAIFRSVVDYALAWSHYFPPIRGSRANQSSTQDSRTTA
jgi:hypothetical protein